MADALRSPSLAGIMHDPDNTNKRVVPASTRPDGSIRKELRVKPGYVAPEDVAKYKVGQGSVRSQLATAQARGQAPPSPSPAAVSLSSSLTTPLRPSPSDFVPRDKPHYPTATPTKPPVAVASKTGAAASRWATAPPDPVPVLPQVIAPAAATRGKSAGTRGGRGGRAKSATRGKRPQVANTDGLAVPASQEGEDDLSAVETESVVSEVPEVPSLPDSVVQTSSEAIPAPPESDPLSLSMEWPDTSAGDWWEEEEDLDIRRATDALKSIAIDGSQGEVQGTTDEREAPPASQAPKQVPSSPSKLGKAIKGTGIKSHVANGKGRPSNTGNDVASQLGNGKNEQRKTSGKHQAAKIAPQPTAQQPSVAGGLLGRMEPRTAEQAKAQTAPSMEPSVVSLGPPPQGAKAVIAGPSSSSTNTDTDGHAEEPAPEPHPAITNMTIEQIKSRSRTISNELRQLNQLRKYSASGAVLTGEQKTRLGQSQSLSQELEGIKLAARELADEVEQLAVAGRS